MEEKILTTSDKHWCIYRTGLLVDEEGYIYEGGICEICGKERKNYDIKLKLKLKQ